MLKGQRGRGEGGVISVFSFFFNFFFFAGFEPVILMAFLNCESVG